MFVKPFVSTSPSPVREGGPGKGRSLALLAGVALLFAAISPRLGSAQHVSPSQVSAVPATLVGSWAHDGDLSRALRTIDAVFAPSVAALPEMLHGFARDRIRSGMPPPRQIAVSVEGSRVRVRLESAERTTTVDGTLGARARTTGVEDGTSVTPRLEGGWLELRYEGEEAVMTQLFSTEPDGARMHLDYHVTNPRLAGPVRYRLEYVRPSR